MAIVGALPGVSVIVVANGSALQEHKDSEVQEDDKVVTRYIEAVSDQVFEVHFSVAKNAEMKGNTLSFKVHVDGHLADNPLVSKDSLPTRAPYCVRKSYGVEMPGGMIRNYRFSLLQALETHGAQAASKFKELGIIRVTMHHMWKKEQETCEVSLADRMKGIQGVGEVSEKALKGNPISHSVRFSAARKARASTFWKTTHVDPSQKPAAVFEFRYRSKEALKAMLIIPRTPSPEPEPEPEPLENRDITTLTQEELRELQRRAREAMHSREQKVNVKQEQRPTSPRRRKTRRSGEITTIELDDDGEVLRETTTKVTPDADSAVELDD